MDGLFISMDVQCVIRHFVLSECTKINLKKEKKNFARNLINFTFALCVRPISSFRKIAIMKPIDTLLYEKQLRSCCYAYCAFTIVWSIHSINEIFCLSIILLCIVLCELWLFWMLGADRSLLWMNRFMTFICLLISCFIHSYSALNVLFFFSFWFVLLFHGIIIIFKFNRWFFLYLLLNVFSK